MAEQAGSAVAEFCLSVKTQAFADVTTRFTAADLNNPDANDDEHSDDGTNLPMKFNFDTLQGDVLQLCSANGITWRRNFAAALKRGQSVWDKMLSGRRIVIRGLELGRAGMTTQL
jgi:hypothetical protein